MSESKPNVSRRAHNFKDITGQKFGKLVALRYSHTVGKTAQWVFQCDCGKQSLLPGIGVRAGYTKSCGCLHATTQSEFGISAKKVRGHGTWCSMIRRCHNAEDKDYPRYGQRGISVCPEWREGFMNFFRDMGERPIGKTLERKNNAEGYSKENCKWATPIEQARNRRSNMMITIGNETRCLAEWVERLGLRRGCYQWRVRHGWDMIRALTTPTSSKERSGMAND